MGAGCRGGPQDVDQSERTPSTANHSSPSLANLPGSAGRGRQSPGAAGYSSERLSGKHRAGGREAGEAGGRQAQLV